MLHLQYEIGNPARALELFKAGLEGRLERGFFVPTFDYTAGTNGGAWDSELPLALVLEALVGSVPDASEVDGNAIGLALLHMAQGDGLPLIQVFHPLENLTILQHTNAALYGFEVTNANHRTVCDGDGYHALLALYEQWAF